MITIYTIYVGNRGKLLEDTSKHRADKQFEFYKQKSITAAGNGKPIESVRAYANGMPYREEDWIDI